MSTTTPVETKVTEPTNAVDTTTTEGDVSTAIVEENASTDPAVIAGELTSTANTEEPPKTTEEEGQVNATEVTPNKTTLTKRRTIFNPFGKSSKKEETTEETKKASKGFGTFFSRSKVTKAEEPTTTAENEVVSTELPQIEQLQPIETDIQVKEENEPTVKEAINEVAEAVEAEVAEVAQEVEQAAAQVTNAVKRQSFISKLFGGNNKKKHQETTRKVTEEHETTEEVHEEVEATTTSEEAPVRPSSPLGKLTELFTKKSPKKAKVPTTAASEDAPKEEEEAPAAEKSHDIEATVKDTNVAEATTTTTTTPAIVTASA